MTHSPVIQYVCANRGSISCTGSTLTARVRSADRISADTRTRTPHTLRSGRDRIQVFLFRSFAVRFGHLKHRSSRLFVIFTENVMVRVRSCWLDPDPFHHNLPLADPLSSLCVTCQHLIAHCCKYGPVTVGVQTVCDNWWGYG